MSGDNIKTKKIYELHEHFEPIALIWNDKLYDKLRSDGRKLFSSDPHNQAISHNGNGILLPRLIGPTMRKKCSRKTFEG